MDTDNRNLFDIRSVSKSFGNTIALDDVSFKIKKGEITSIYGPNGAGKSTLLRILCGVETEFKGSVLFNGSKISFSRYIDALKAGISYIPQDFGLIPNLSAWENIDLSHNQNKNKFWYHKDPRGYHHITKKFHFDYTYFDDLINHLTAYQKQIVAIFKALSFNSAVYIFDESTTSMSGQDFLKFVDLVKILKKNGATIIFISHKIDEVFEISDSIVILRKGKYLSEYSVKNANKDEIIQLFVSDVSIDSQQINKNNIFLLSQVEMNRDNSLKLEFRIYKGEVLNIETGNTSLNQSLGYEVYNWLIENESLKIGIITSNRDTEGIFNNLSVKENLLANTYQNGKKSFFLKDRIKVLNEVAEKLELKYEDWDQSITNLSGGNKQKVVFGRWMIADFDILVLIEPTAGIDLKSKQIIHQKILEMVNTGKSFILVTSDEGEKLSLRSKNIEINQLC